MKTFKCNTIVDLYKFAVDSLLNDPEQVRSPRDQKIHEILGAHIQINNPMMCMWNEDSDSRPYPLQYLKNELIAYLACVNDTETFAGISSFWKKLEDFDGVINSAYGKIVNKDRFTNRAFDYVEPHLDSSRQLASAWHEETFTQMEWVLESFKKDKQTRQALMFVASPFYQYKDNKDFICTLNYHFIINQDNELDLIVNRRSQDIHFGMTFDIPWEVVLQNIVLYEIQKMYPEVTLGKYYLNCNSLHMYERNFDVYKNFVNDTTIIPQSLPAMNGNYFEQNTSDEFRTWLQG